MRYKTLRCGTLIVFVALLVSCGNDEPPAGPHATPVLLPLAIGNAWMYQISGSGAEEETGFDPIISVTGTMTIAGETYYSIEVPALPPPIATVSSSSSEVARATLLQNRPDGLFFARYDEQEGFSDDLLFRFPPPETAGKGNADPGRDIVYQYQRQSSEVIQMQVQHIQVTIAGRTVDSLEYRIVGDDRFFAAFAVDVGCVRAFDLFWPGILMELNSF